MNSVAPEPASLADWLSYLETLHPQAIEMGLARIARVRSDLSLIPSFPIIIVGGTNGKGSVCTMLESILHCAGYRVGCYISPHLLQYNERVRIGKKNIDDKSLCEAFAQINSVRQYSNTSLTYFEFGTLAAVLCFMQAQVDVAILEVGLGGRLDAVNIFDADCSILTSIDFDHMDYLGDSREKIGFEKAAIFRENRPAICAELDIPQSVSQHAGQTGAVFYRLGKEFGYAIRENQWDFWDQKSNRLALPLPILRGEKQVQNASACLMALNTLCNLLPVSMNNIRQGLLEAVIPGRFQVISTQPMIILDVAHNPAAAIVLAKNLASTKPNGRTYAVFAMLRDKDIQGVIQVLKEHIDCWLVATILTPRAAPSEYLLNELDQAGIKGEHQRLQFDGCAEAFVFACEQAGKNDRICVFGSFYTVSDVLQHLAKAQNK